MGMLSPAQVVGSVAEQLLAKRHVIEWRQISPQVAILHFSSKTTAVAFPTLPIVRSGADEN
jgi:hypothetical protein